MSYYKNEKDSPDWNTVGDKKPYQNKKYYQKNNNRYYHNNNYISNKHLEKKVEKKVDLNKLIKNNSGITKPVIKINPILNFNDGIWKIFKGIPVEGNLDKIIKAAYGNITNCCKEEKSKAMLMLRKNGYYGKGIRNIDNFINHNLEDNFTNNCTFKILAAAFNFIDYCEKKVLPKNVELFGLEKDFNVIEITDSNQIEGLCQKFDIKPSIYQNITGNILNDIMNEMLFERDFEYVDFMNSGKLQDSYVDRIIKYVYKVWTLDNTIPDYIITDLNESLSFLIDVAVKVRVQSSIQLFAVIQWLSTLFIKKNPHAKVIRSKDPISLMDTYMIMNKVFATFVGTKKPHSDVSNDYNAYLLAYHNKLNNQDRTSRYFIDIVFIAYCLKSIMDSVNKPLDEKIEKVKKDLANSIKKCKNKEEIKREKKQANDEIENLIKKAVPNPDWIAPWYINIKLYELIMVHLRNIKDWPSIKGYPFWHSDIIKIGILNFNSGLTVRKFDFLEQAGLETGPFDFREAINYSDQISSKINFNTKKLIKKDAEDPEFTNDLTRNLMSYCSFKTAHRTYKYSKGLSKNPKQVQLFKLIQKFTINSPVKWIGKQLWKYYDIFVLTGNINSLKNHIVNCVNNAKENNLSNCNEVEGLLKSIDELTIEFVRKNKKIYKPENIDANNQISL